MRKVVFFLLFLLGISVVSFIGGRKWSLKHDLRPIERVTDTIYHRDTITAYKPLYFERVKTDSVLVPVVDTLKLHDTLYVFLQRERVEWRDSLCAVYASGVQVQVDSVTHYLSEREVIIREKVVGSPRWSLGVTGGYGVGANGLTPYIGLGVTYNILSW